MLKIMDETFSDKINLDELYARRNELEDNKEKVYKTILSRVHKKIKLTSRQRNGETFTFFIIPEFLLGVPLYDTAACTAYIINKLTENGFIIKYTHPNLLFISWQHHIDKRKRAEIKKLYGINVDGKGNMIKNQGNKESSTNMNSLLLKNEPIKIKDKKEYRPTTDYKPTGNLIYSENLIKKIEDRTKNS
jgi:hypothetical protein